MPNNPQNMSAKKWLPKANSTRDVSYKKKFQKKNFDKNHFFQRYVHTIFLAHFSDYNKDMALLRE